MKTELIEYHRDKQKFHKLRATDFKEGSIFHVDHVLQSAFHERAVAWLESLQEPVNEREPKVYSKV